MWLAFFPINVGQLATARPRLTMDSLVPDLSKAWLADKDGVPADAIRKAADEDAGGLAGAAGGTCGF